MFKIFSETKMVFGALIVLFIICSCGAPIKNSRPNLVIDLDENLMTATQTSDIMSYALMHPGWHEVFESAGLLVHLESFDPTEGYVGFFKEVLSGWDITFTSNWYAMPLKDGRIIFTDGVTYSDIKLILLTIHDCPGHSALIHELGHVIRSHFELPEDLNHSDYKFWSPVNRLMDNMTDDLCPEDYRPEEPFIIEIAY